MYKSWAKNIQQTCLLMVAITSIWAYISSEPDYKHMLYGGVWKHVIFNPPEDTLDIVQASKHLILFIKTWHPDAITDNLTLTCLNKIDLLYSHSDHASVSITEYINTKNGNEIPISVPLILGYTYNFQLTIFHKDSMKTIHHFTITRTSKVEQFFIYSHIFYTINGLQKQHLRSCSREGSSFSKLPILTNLAENKKLDSNLGCLSETDNMLKQCKETNHFHYSNDDDLDTRVSFQKLRQKMVAQEENNRHSNKTVITIMTYNIWNFNTYQQKEGDYFRRINQISKLLNKANPDIVAFQEVRLEMPLGGNLGPCQMNHLISLLPKYQFVYQPAQMQENSLEQGRTEEGLAIFSRYPIIYHDYLLMFRNQSNSADLNQRICLHAVILVPSFGKVHIFNTHFSLSHEAREAAVTQILEYISIYDGELVVLTGDLNAAPTEKAIRMLSKDSGLLDTWHHINPSCDGFTFSCIEDKLSKRIDYIFIKKTHNVLVQEVDVLNDKTREDAASDHRAVLATLVFK